MSKAAAADGKGEVAIGYGEFIQSSINFLIIAWAMFVVIKAMNSLNRKPPPPVAPAAVPDDVRLLSEIRDLLKKCSQFTFRA